MTHSRIRTGPEKEGEEGGGEEGGGGEIKKEK